MNEYPELRVLMERAREYDRNKTSCGRGVCNACYALFQAPTFKIYAKWSI